ncbi:MAG: sugar ABC transporter permease [Defluviitaleaceae bacterium]|nr:sugar ABC transporter permease [Defluviitaleaceae bacterium]
MKMKKITFAAFMLPFAAGFVLCMAAPLFYGLALSFFDIFSNEFVGLQNYAGVIKNPVFLRAALNTAVLAAAAITALVAVSFFISCVLMRMPGRQSIAKIMAVPLAVPAVSVSYVWYSVFHYKGYLNGVLSVFFGRVNINWFSGPLMYLPVILLFLWKNAGFAALIYLSGLNAIPREYEDVLRLDSEKLIDRIRLIYWPCVFPQTFFVIIIGLWRVMNIFTEIYAVWSDYPPLPLYLLQHFIYHNYMNMEYGRSVAAAVFLSFMVLAFAVIFRMAEKRYSDE